MVVSIDPSMMVYFLNLALLCRCAVGQMLSNIKSKFLLQGAGDPYLRPALKPKETF